MRYSNIEEVSTYCYEKTYVCLNDCGDGKYRSGDYCYDCSENCLTCDVNIVNSEEVMTCSGCNEGYNLSNNVCVLIGFYYGYNTVGIKEIGTHACRHDCSRCSYDLLNFKLTCNTCKEGFIQNA